MTKEELFKTLQKTGSAGSSVLSESTLFSGQTHVKSDVPILNIALGASMNIGLGPGAIMIVGPSRHFKSLLGLMLVKAYLNTYSDAICLFYDSEFGITEDYFKTNNIDTSRVIHTPILNIEQLKFDLMAKLDKISRGDKVIVFIDSIGNLASKKEADDALSENEALDMTRAKQMKSLWRIVTPHLPIKDIPLVAINHSYMEQKMYGKQIMSGGQGPMLSANHVWMIGKSQEKQGADLIGYNFTINIDKSRFVREKSKFPFTVTFEGGIQKYSGLLDIAVESGIVIKPSNGFYQKVNLKTGEPEGNKFREKETHTADFWDSILESEEFEKYLAKRYRLGYNEIMADSKEDPEHGN